MSLLELGIPGQLLFHLALLDFILFQLLTPNLLFAFEPGGVCLIPRRDLEKWGGKRTSSNRAEGAASAKNINILQFCSKARGGGGRKKKLILMEENSLASPYLAAEKRAKDFEMPERKIQWLFQ